MTPRTRWLTCAIASFWVSGRRMKMVSYSRSVPGSSLIDCCAIRFSSWPYVRRLARRRQGVLLFPVEPVHRGGCPCFHNRLDRIRRFHDRERQLLLFHLRKIAQHIIGWVPAWVRPRDA